ncbi:hypothetical protein GCM10010472_46160 [Pseudonocardia halophobica]|uniref:Uncharacterized protein n=1 Tax=Pseudonocardia halophobica TaxID=29401 RepID=A0A9W6L5E2_9PSEU|nr:hypothetical protein [Pseudonocardia halophobica]GLL13951.1 hypothetical protein GCM10017577_50960 [Pseudonocardia halophobica]
MTVPVPGDPRPMSARPLEAVRADVEAALGALDALAEQPAEEHVAVFERVHAALGAALAAGSPERA